VDLEAAGLSKQPFPAGAGSTTVVPYSSFTDGLATLERVCNSHTGIALIQGPALSGKSTMIGRFLQTLPDERDIAVVDGDRANKTRLLEALLRAFGFDHEFSSTSELMAMTRVYVLQQASAGQPPVVVIKNADTLGKGALKTLSALAALRVRQTSGIKLVLVSEHSLAPLLESPLGQDIAQRVIADFHCRPMSSGEALNYLHTKLRAAGSDTPEYIIPISVCNLLWQASGGWPGILDRLALLALAGTQTLPVSASAVEHPAIPEGTWNGAGMNGSGDDGREHPPVLYLTQNGRTLNKFVFDKPRLLVGRSDHNDMAIDSRFVSRHHMLLVRHGDATFLMDLNSSNGTYVNSRRVSNQLLVNDDIITVGHHRIKFHDPHAKQRGGVETIEFSDTIIMRSLEDMHSLLEKENTSIYPVQSENLPTLGG
jgi:type II secretory pathway predicted ATPase ExeA